MCSKRVRLNCLSNWRPRPTLPYRHPQIKFALFGPLALPKDDDVRVWRWESILEVAAVHDLNSLA